MFPFFGNQQNPFMSMMNPEAPESDEGMNMPMLPFMQQAFMMQMQFMQNMCMMPFYMMQNMASMLNKLPGDAAPQKAAPGQAKGFKLGNMEIPPEMLGTLLSMDMSPENLEKLQKLLDVVFEAMPKTTGGNADEE